MLVANCMEILQYVRMFWRLTLTFRTWLGGTLRLTVFPCANGSLTQPGNSYTLFDCSRKEGLLVGAVSHTQIILSHHKHIHLPACMHAHTHAHTPSVKATR